MKLLLLNLILYNKLLAAVRPERRRAFQRSLCAPAACAARPSALLPLLPQGKLHHLPPGTRHATGSTPRVKTDRLDKRGETGNAHRAALGSPKGEATRRDPAPRGCGSCLVPAGSTKGRRVVAKAGEQWPRPQRSPLSPRGSRGWLGSAGTGKCVGNAVLWWQLFFLFHFFLRMVIFRI